MKSFKISLEITLVSLTRASYESYMRYTCTCTCIYSNNISVYRGALAKEILGYLLYYRILYFSFSKGKNFV